MKNMGVHVLQICNAESGLLTLGSVPERRNNSISGINVPYFRVNFIPGINYVPGRRNNAIKGINLG